jgi:branched-chain amino acid transport system substrate-binding protein
MRLGRTVRLVAPLAVAVVTAGACSSSSSGGSGGGSGEPTFTIAFQGPLSGGNSQLGLNITGGVKLAINQANAGTTFGKLPFKLAYQEQDDQGSSAIAPTATQKILGIKNLIAVVGPVFSGATKASEPAYSQHNIATVTPSASETDLATSGWHNFFRLVAGDSLQGPADAEYLGRVAKITSVYAVDDASAYGAGLIKAFDDATSKFGVRLVKHKTAPGTTQCQAGNGNVQQYNTLATQIKSSGAKSVMYAGYYCDFALLAKQLRAAGFTGQLLSDDGSNDGHYVSQAGASVANGTVISCACQEVISGPAFSTFAADFKALAGFVPGTYSAEGYDATNTIIKAMSSLGANPTPAGIVTALHAPGFKWKGVSKTVRFKANGDSASATVYMYKVENGTIKELGPISTL